MSAPRPTGAPRVKICGVRRGPDVEAAAEAGADFVGLVLAESPRRVDPAAAAELARQAVGVGLRPVGVFVDRPTEEVDELARRIGLFAAQLHGDESPETCRSLRREEREVWKAVRPRGREELEEAVERYAGAADALLVEGWSPEAPGGTGTAFPHEWLEAGAERARDFRLILAGGLDPDNVAGAVRTVRPDVVDVSSGVESAPGRKEAALIRAFVQAVRGVGGVGGDETGSAGSPATGGSREERGRYGVYGGRYVPETLMPALEELEDAWDEAWAERDFRTELDGLLADYVGRPSPLYRADRLGEALGGVRVWLKREDLNHTGAHKINNTLGQALLARRMGKERVIAETGAGQHGVATATACALLDQDCVVYMGEEDMRRQALNVERMRLLGAEVRPVSSGRGTLKDATNEAIRDWVEHVRDTHYIIGSVVGPAPYPRIVRELQRVIGDEARRQMIERGVAPDAVFACVGGGSNAIGIFTAFLGDDVELVGVEAAGEGLDTGRHAASLAAGRPGVLHGSLSYLLQDEAGQVLPAHSVSAGLDYPAVGPEHARLRDEGRVRYEAVEDGAALEAFGLLARREGILPALEAAHALAGLGAEADRWSERDVLLCLSGRGDKDVAEVARLTGEGGAAPSGDPDPPGATDREGGNGGGG